MNTKTLSMPSIVQKVVLFAAGVSLVFAGYFAIAPQAHAAALTEPQIQAILNLLIAFNVPAATIANVNTILHKSK